MRRIRRPSHTTVVAYIALFLVLSGGTAVALAGANTVFTDDIANDTQPASGGNPAGGLVAADLRPNSVGSSEVANDRIAGADINESSLGQVPSALLGGFGRSNGGQFCNPESATFIPCAVVTLNLPKQARLLLVAQAKATFDDSSENAGNGFCRIGTDAGYLPETQTRVDIDRSTNETENLSLVGVTGPFPPGQHSFRIACSEFFGGIYFLDVGISAVAISPN